jgi:hypothetical protein
VAAILRNRNAEPKWGHRQSRSARRSRCGKSG